MMYSCAVFKAGGGETGRKNCLLCETQPMIMNGTMIRNIILIICGVKKIMLKHDKTLVRIKFLK